MNLHTPLAALAATASVLLAACAGGPSTSTKPSEPAPTTSRPASAPAAAAPVAVPAAGTCNAAQAQFALGQQANANMLEDARRRSGSDMARVLRPGQVVTMEFNAQRLNLHADASGKVVRAVCG